MHDKAKELFAAFKAGQMSRRELMSGAAKLGVSAATVPCRSLSFCSRGRYARCASGSGSRPSSPRNTSRSSSAPSA